MNVRLIIEFMAIGNPYGYGKSEECVGYVENNEGNQGSIWAVT